jgi:hypothetical protein
MDANKSTFRPNPAQEAFDRTQSAIAAQRARRTSQNDAQAKREPGHNFNGPPDRAWFATSR